jgi:hypothetical protein
MDAKIKHRSNPVPHWKGKTGTQMEEEIKRDRNKLLVRILIQKCVATD